MHTLPDAWTAMQVVLDTVTVELALDSDPKAASGDEADAATGPLQGHKGACQPCTPTHMCRSASL